jgi:DUF4097 and DUF4098 domain-containing protein YvlB
MEKTFETPGPLTVMVELAAGRIELETHAEPRAYVALEGLDEESRGLVEQARVELRERAGAQELVIEAPERKGWGGFFLGGRRGFDLRVRCPEGSALRVQSKSADIRGRGRFGTVDISTASGDLAIEEIAGDARLKSVSGDVEVAKVAGEASAQSTSGDVKVGRVAGSLTISSVSGDLLVSDAAGNVGANTVSGDQRLEAVREGSVHLQSVSGDVNVGIRRGSRVYLDCNTMSGDTSSDLEVSGGPVSEDGPLVELRAKTVSGDIRVVRAAAVSEEVSA